MSDIKSEPTPSDAMEQKRRQAQQAESPQDVRVEPAGSEQPPEAMMDEENLQISDSETERTEQE